VIYKVKWSTAPVQNAEILSFRNKKKTGVSRSPDLVRMH